MTTKIKRGPGDHLHTIIRTFTGEDLADCSCAKWIERMNKWGADGCEKRLERIIKHLQREARERDWWKLLAKVPGARWPLRWMITEAIRRSSKEC